ncbi:MAG TPA: Calx-beta domain-containing protein [Chthoniobacterales bacterium]|jgi:uncharacterized delta-60 repeat protein|nr:Calx-beta domain-containing protein [Chthoniobacterales bacterium]
MHNPFCSAFSSSKTAIALISLSLVLGSSTLRGAVRTWTGASPVNNFWATGQNWSGGVAPVPGDDLAFPSAASRATSVNNFPAGTTFGALFVDGHTMSGAAIALDGGISSTGAQIQLSSIKLNANQTFFLHADNPLIISSAIDTAGRTLTLQSSETGRLILSGAISGSGTISKTGAGNVTVTGNSASFSNTFLREGTYLVNGSNPGSAIFIVGSTLGGTGTTGGIRFGFANGQLTGVIAPGDGGPGILSVSNGVDLNETLGAQGNPTLLLDLNGTTVGTGYDQLNVTGAVDLGTRAQPRVIIGAGFVPTAGDIFTIIKNDGADEIVGTFLNLPEGTQFVAGGVTFAISYRGGDGNDVTLTSISGTVTFTSNGFSVNENAGTASITLHRTGGGNTTASVAVALEDQTTTPADYVSPAGTLDVAFNSATGSGADNQVRATALQANGRILIGGDFNNYNGTARRGIARLNTSGTLDTSFNPGTGPRGGLLFRIVVDAAGKILIGGEFTTYNGISRNGIARLNSNGSLDTTFDPGTGAAQTGTQTMSVNAIALQPDGKILIGGSFNQYNGVSRARMARLNPDGSLDASFTPALTLGFGLPVKTIAVTSDSKILVGGYFTENNGILRLNADGTRDPTFRGPGNSTDTGTEVIVPLPDGGMIIGGTFQRISGAPRRGIARLDADGFLDSGFEGTNSPDGNVFAIILEPDGRILIGGGFNNYGGVPRDNVARVKPDGSLDTSFDPEPFSPPSVPPRGTVFALLRQADGKTVVAAPHGSSVFSGNIERMNGDLVATWGPNDFADKTLQLPIVNDTLFEGTERLNLRIVFMRNAVAGTPATAALTILDDDGATPPAPAKAVNIATRLRVATGDNVMIAGFILTGNVSKEVVLRGMGPLLGSFGINDFLADPVLDLRGPGGSILQNNNWKDTQRSQIEGTVYQPGDDRESVIVATLQPDSYTAILTGVNNTTGVGLIEVYDNNPAADSQLANISTRGLVQGNNSVMIGGFILGGDTGNSRIALRAIGPSLAQSGLSGVLADPTLELHDGNGAPLFSNDDWETDTNSANQLRANGLGLSNPKESGLFVSLPPGPFTAILAGKNGGTGIGLIEIFNLR